MPARVIFSVAASLSDDRNALAFISSAWSHGAAKKEEQEFYYFEAKCKSQLISECLFDVLNFPKNQQKNWQISALEYKK